MGRTTGYPPMAHGSYDRISSHGPWVVRQNILPWPMGRTMGYAPMGHGSYDGLCPHDPWVVRQAMPPWVMDRTTAHPPMAHGSYNAGQSMGHYISRSCDWPKKENFDG